MQVLFFNEALMNAAKSFGVDLVCEEDLPGKLGYSEMSHAVIVGKAIHEFACLKKLGIHFGEPSEESETKAGESDFDFNAVLLENGIIDPERQITPRLNVIATKTNALIFYIDDCDHMSSVSELIINALGKVLSMSEILESQIWSHYCKCPD